MHNKKKRDNQSGIRLHLQLKEEKKQEQCRNVADCSRIYTFSYPVKVSRGCAYVHIVRVTDFKQSRSTLLIGGLNFILAPSLPFYISLLFSFLDLCAFVPSIFFT